VKAFRGTFIAIFALILVWWVTQPSEIVKPSPTRLGDDAPSLFQFEKSALTRVDIVRSEETLSLAEQSDGAWLIEGPSWPAASSMVNRIKHQLHDLTARAAVVDNPDRPELYGLGTHAIRVTLTFRDRDPLTFEVGDPNPTSVSWYLRPLPGQTIFTAKKSAMDSFEMPITEFRERRFATFEATDADRIEASVAGHAPLTLQRTGKRAWALESPIEARASAEAARRLLGRISALKASDFGPDAPEDLAPFGLDQPRATLRVKFASRDELVLRIGQALTPEAGEKPVSDRERRAYMSIDGQPTIFIARDQLLSDFTEAPDQMRNLRFLRLESSTIAQYTLVLNDHDGLSTDAPITIRRTGDKWMWADGNLAAGSTTRRVTERASSLRAKEIAAERVSPQHGMDSPRLQLTLETDEGVVRVLSVGAEGPAEVVPAQPVPGPPGGAPINTEGPREERRFYAQADDDPMVYLIDSTILSTAEDLHREQSRKEDKRADRKARLEKIEAP